MVSLEGMLLCSLLRVACLGFRFTTISVNLTVLTLSNTSETALTYFLPQWSPPLIDNKDRINNWESFLSNFWGKPQVQRGKYWEKQTLITVIQGSDSNNKVTSHVAWIANKLLFIKEVCRFGLGQYITSEQYLAIPVILSKQRRYSSSYSSLSEALK